MIPENTHLNIGSLLFEDLDQIDLTGPFEVLSRLPNSTHRIYAKTMAPVRDVMGCVSCRTQRLLKRRSWTSCTFPAGRANRL